jgi:iron complex outermembrane receptor protein
MRSGGQAAWENPQIVCAGGRALCAAHHFFGGNFMFELKPIARQLLLACGGLAGALLLAGPATAQQAQQGQEQKLERITITGSNIRRTDTETVAPVEIVTREEIERSGRTTVADVLKTIPSNTGGLYNETANSFAPGSSSVSLRGLGQAATLVLINGRRVAGYGFAQNIQDSFVDLNQIPASAVERIEILKDGASAIYGSDAIAGVVNVILRRDFKGIEVGAGASFFESSKKEYRANLTAGFGDLGSQRFNVFGTLDFFKRDGMTMADTEFGRTRDLRGIEGGRNFQSLTAGGTWVGQGPANSAAANTRRAIAECPNVVDYAGAVARGLLPVGQSNQALGTGFNQPGNTWCVRDFANVFSVIPDSQRIGFLGKATFDFTNEMQGFIEAGFSRNETDFKFQEPFFAGTTRFFVVPPPVSLAPSPFNATFAPGVAGNPLGINAQYSGVLNDFGTRDTEITADALRILGGLKYRAFNWDFDSALGYSESKIDQKSTVLFTQGTIAALGLPTTLQPPTPVVTGGATYNLDRPSTNSQAVRNQMFGSVVRDAKSDLQFIDTKASTETGVMLPGGAVGVAVGAEYRRESILSVPTDVVRTGGILGQGSTSVDGSRNSLAAYTEFALPLTKTLESQAALRYDRYSDFGSTVNPKVGLKFKPSAEFLIRANWGRGFKAPSLPEITPSSAFFFTTITEPLTGAASQIAGSINANPNLKPERSRSTTLGFVWEPTVDFSLGVDLYEIKRTDQVTFEDFQAIADNPTDPRAFRDPVTGFVLSIAGAYTNLGETFTRGADFDIRFKQRTTIGAFTTRLNATYLDSFEIDGLEAAGDNIAFAFTNTASLPRWKGAFIVDWEQGPAVVSIRTNYIHGYQRAFGAATFYGTGSAAQVAATIPQTGRLSRRAPSYTTFDLFARYNVTPSLTVNAGVINITDELPIYEPGISTTYFYDRTQAYDIRGRYFNVGLRYTFR